MTEQDIQCSAQFIDGPHYPLQNRKWVARTIVCKGNCPRGMAGTENKVFVQAEGAYPKLQECLRNKQRDCDRVRAAQKL